MKKLGLLLILVSFFAQGQIKRVEPPFWWVGMNNTHLELVIYGKNINAFNVKIKGSGVVLTEVKKTENPNYLFVDLDLSKAKAGSFKLLFSHSKLKNFKYTYTLKRVKKNRHNARVTIILM